MAKKKAPLAVAAKAIDPTLDALFSTSSGPVKAPPVSRYSKLPEKKAEAADEGDDEVLSEISEELDYEDDSDEGESAEEEEEEEDDDQDQEESEDEDDQEPSGAKLDAVDATKAPETALEQPATTTETTKSRKERKRKRKDDNEGLEEKYLAELTKSDGPATKRRKDLTTVDKDDDNAESDDDNDVPVHESLAKEDKSDELDKAARTVFLANVSTEAITSKTAKKSLLTHLSSVLAQDASPPEKIESIRFRSLAFSTGSMPKRAAFITGSLMDATTKSANAYVVYPTAASARKAAADLNGSEVLGRHIRVDSVAHPSPTDHRRCVFVGNLGFVDDETVLNTNGEGETSTKKRNKVPADVEEGLWRTFSTQGKVENVRVVRDPKTRVGKGFAYVQFYDTNDVESALLLDGKKFPPMLPRALRVTRAKDPRKTALAQERKAKGGANAAPTRDTKYKPKLTPEQQSMAGRAGRLLGRAGAAQQRRAARMYPKKDPKGAATGGFKTPEQVVFEGSRASSKDGHKGLKFGKKGKPSGRGARRAAEWKKKKS